MKSILKWPGGKRATADLICSHFPAYSGNYIEPFCGGLSVFLAHDPVSALLSDSNRWLISTYKTVRDCPCEVMLEVDGLVVGKENYYRIRESAKFLWRASEVRSAALMLYLVKSCFRGIFRVNRKGEFNTPFGQSDRDIYDHDELMAFSKRIQNPAVVLSSCDFRKALENTTKTDFVYLDPPYYGSDFVRYTPEVFEESSHMDLAGKCEWMTSKGIRWAQSNSDNAFVRSLYGEYRLVEIECRREVNLDASKRKTSELLILNFSEEGKVIR